MDDLLSNDDFIGFCNRWEQDRCCPLPLADWLAERDMWTAYEAALWAANELCDCKYDSKRKLCPKFLKHQMAYKWSSFCLRYGFYCSNWAPIDPASPVRFFDTFAESIAYYLENFDPEIATAVTNKNGLRKLYLKRTQPETYTGDSDEVSHYECESTTSGSLT